MYRWPWALPLCSVCPPVYSTPEQWEGRELGMKGTGLQPCTNHRAHVTSDSGLSDSSKTGQDAGEYEAPSLLCLQMFPGSFVPK